MTLDHSVRKPLSARKPLAGAAAIHFPSRQDVIAAALRERILRGELAGGSRLDIDEIAAAHGVSRTPVRDALKQLETEGLVQVFPYRGVEVTTLTQADLEELFSIRVALEQLCIGRVIERVTPQQLEGMRRTLRRMDRLKRRDEGWTDLNTEFHNAIYDAAGWPRLADMLRTQRVNIERYVRARAGDLGTDRQQAQHWTLLEAMEKGDRPTALATIQAHYMDTVATMSLPAGGAG
ncbi:GntR family transcriptional regulator [Pararoseomonas indoligenes]|uniref:GntR family transcriptional regulator n=1 Tax=Roseomonas indoligenes TaxID=2820811 RepID=A0A940N1H4_9PROT|nr:GntR family transcriptional regulator [Pararoseomonas indoligenes]MBP0495000.1 GntR family transcriptional regulator [Pararoseomonas indoligenes]